jgi:hypothetical protein
MDPNSSILLFYYYWQLWRNARERERLESELAAEVAEVSGVFTLGPTKGGSTPGETSRRHLRRVGR